MKDKLEIYATEEDVFKWYNPPINITKQTLVREDVLALRLPTKAYVSLKKIGQFNLPLSNLNLAKKLEEKISNLDFVGVLNDGSDKYLTKTIKGPHLPEIETIVNLYKIVDYS